MVNMGICTVRSPDRGGRRRVRENRFCKIKNSKIRYLQSILRGNNDFFSDLPKEEVFSLENYRIMVTHGHMYGVSLSTCQLEEAITIPVINGRAFLTGINLQKTIDQLVEILKK